MKRLFLILGLATSLAAQVSPPSPQSRVGGRFVAYNYGLWSLPTYTVPSGTGSKTFTLSNSTVVLPDGRKIMPFNVNAPIYIGSEKVTVTAVGSGCLLNSVAIGGCSITATFTQAHTNADPVSSGTFGLQEALNDAGASGGGAVTVDSAWANLGGTTAMTAAATIPTGVTVEDGRIGVVSATPVTVAPSGSCTAGLPNQQVTSTGVQYSCQGGTWAAIGGGGAVSSVSNADGTLSVTPTIGDVVASIPTGHAFPADGAINITAAPYNASGFIAQTTLASSCASGSTSCSVISATGFSVGQAITIALAGAAGGNAANYTGLISSITGTGPYTIAFTSVSGASIPPTSVSGATTGATAAAGNTVWTFGSTQTTGTTGAGTSVVLSNAASYNVGNGILITGAGAAGANYVGSITAVNGNTLTVSPATTTSVAAGTNVQHDDTTAFQTALNLASYTRSVKIIVPDGYYQINGPAQNTGTANAILQLPNLSYFTTAGYTQWFPMASVTIEGVNPAPNAPTYLSNRNIVHFSGSILATQATGGVNLLGAYNSGNTDRAFTNIFLHVLNLTLRAYPNPNVNMLNLQYVAAQDLKGISIDTGDTGATAEPTNASTAIFNSTEDTDGNNTISNFQILGFQNGVYGLIEHLRMMDGRFDNVKYPWVITGGAYGGMGKNIQFNGCTYGIYATTGTTKLQMTMMNIEHQTSPTWATNVDDVYDPSGFLFGVLTYDTNNPTFNVQGAANLSLINIKNWMQSQGPLTIGSTGAGVYGSATLTLSTVPGGPAFGGTLATNQAGVLVTDLGFKVVGNVEHVFRFEDRSAYLVNPLNTTGEFDFLDDTTTGCTTSGKACYFMALGNGGAAFSVPVGTLLKATSAISGIVPVKVDTANANQVVQTTTTDTGAGIPLGVCAGYNSGSGTYVGYCNVVTTGVVPLKLGTGTCAIGQFVIVDTTTNGDVQCTSTFTAGTVIGVAMAAQASVGSTFNVMVGLR